MMNIAIPRIIVADDHPLMLAALQVTLNQVFPRVEIYEANSIDAVLECLNQFTGEVDLLLLDLDMPGSRGFTGLFTILRAYPMLTIAIVSATQSPQIVRRAIEFGAAGYIFKSMGPAAMQQAVVALLDGQRYVPPEIQFEATDPTLADDAELGRRLKSLTPQQLKILAFIVDGKLNKQISAELNVVEQTVKMHVSAIFKKLNVQSRTQAAILAERLYPGTSPDRLHDFQRLK